MVQSWSETFAEGFHLLGGKGTNLYECMAENKESKIP